MEREIKVWATYQHFKGGLYKVLTTAIHSETGELLIIYQNIEDSSKIWARPKDLFLSEVDHTKYPEVSQKRRFTLIHE